MIDIGLNLTSPQFDPDRAQVIQRALNAGVSGFLLTGTSLMGSQQALELVLQNFGYMRSTAGVHPHQARTWNAQVAGRIDDLLRQEAVAAVGECGLDYDRMASPMEAQRHAFSDQLDLGLRHNKPAFLHFRPGPHDQGEALGHFLEDLAPRVREGLRGVVHCFTADATAMDRFLELGLYLGITGWVCDERRGANLGALLPSIPDDRLMVETDAPYLIPRTLSVARHQRRNEPAFLPHVVEAVARLRGQSVADVVHFTTANVQRCFGWPLMVEQGRLVP